MYYKFIPAKKTGKKCLQKGLVQVRFRKTSLATILDKIDGKFVPLPPPPNQGWENGAFWLCAALSLILGGRGIAVPYFSVQDCS